jgi:hypothetical protein
VLTYFFLLKEVVVATESLFNVHKRKMIVVFTATSDLNYIRKLVFLDIRLMLNSVSALINWIYGNPQCYKHYV